MEIIVAKGDLLDCIQKTQGAVSSKSTLPILSNVLLEAAADTITLTATDLDIAISSTAKAAVKAPGSITIPAKKFFDIVRELPADDVYIELKKGVSIEVRCGRSVFKLIGLPKDDFPQIPKLKSNNPIIIPQNLLNQMIKLTSFAMSRDDARYILNGILFTLKGNKIRLVATDGRRLAMVDRDLKNTINTQHNVVIPIKGIQELNRNFIDEGDVEINLQKNQIQFDLNNTIITSRLIEGEFPDYEQVIPKKNKERLVLDTQEFLQATKRANIFTNQESQSIKIDLQKNQLVISKNTPDVGELREEIETEYSGSDISIGFNPNYLIDVLKNIKEDKVQFELTDPEKPGVIKVRENYTYIILPMQLS